MGTKLYDQFQPGQTTLDGVPIPYAGWVGQMTGCPPTVAQALVPYPQYCGNLYGLNENAGNSTYNSLQVKAEKRFSRGLWILSSYTWSKNIDSGADTQSASLLWSAVSGAISPFERQRNKGLSQTDVPHTFSLALVYQLPFGKGARFLNRGGTEGAIFDKLLGGWEVANIFRAQSGIPFYFRSSQCEIPGQFAMACIPGVLPSANPFSQSISNFNPNEPLFNRAAFESADLFTFYGGQGPRMSNLRGFPYHNHDFGLIKTTSITERWKFQFRAEFFNVWNWHFFSGGRTWGEYGEPFNTDLASPSFGQWSGTVTTPRNIQIGGRILF
jgi:hypothetical protein